jgi:peptidoglycan hydrolase CwlO-like protein
VALDQNDVAWWVALFSMIGIAISTVGAKYFDNLIAKRKSISDATAQLRADEHNEVLALRAQVDNLNERIEDLAEKYYKVLQERVVLEGRIEENKAEIRHLKEQIRNNDGRDTHEPE